MDMLDNKLFWDTPLSFDRKPEEFLEGAPSDVGVTVTEDREIRFCVYAPKAECATIVAATSGVSSHTVGLSKCDDGAFRGILACPASFTGPVNLKVYLNGDLILDPYIPIIWTLNRPHNYVEVPDAEMDYLLMQQVPHGGYVRQFYWAEAMNGWERCTIYTPPGYMNGADSYPVLYLLNGGTDNETSWEYAGRASHILDNLIAKGDAEPFLAVMNNAMLRKGGKVSMMRDRGFERMLIDSCIPFIEQNYRVKAGKWNRAIAGLSMGAYMACDISMANPDLFGYVGHFTASMTKTELQEDYERPYSAFLARTSPEQFAEMFKVYFRSTTPQEDHLEFFLSDDELISNAGLDRAPCYRRILYPERTSKWNSWRLGFRDFSSMLFKPDSQQAPRK